MKIGFDLGYGYAKLCFGRNYNYKIFPSVLTKAEVFEEGAKDFNKYHLEIDGKHYYIGHAAMSSKSKLLLSAFEGDRLNSKIYRLLFLTGLASCINADDELNVVTGLPINAYRTHKDEVERFKGGYELVLDNRYYEFKINTIRCIPQPLGTYFKLLPAYPSFTDESMLIVDVGFKTTDLLRMEKDRPLATSLSINVGMSDVARKVTAYVNSQIDGRTWILNEVDELLDKGYVNKGKRQKVPKHIVEPAINEVFQAIWSRIVEHFPEYGTLDRIIFTGGSSLRFKELLNDIPLESMAISGDPQLANAIGYREVLEWNL